VASAGRRGQRHPALCLVQLEKNVGLDNKVGALQPGAYAEVKFPLPAGQLHPRARHSPLLFRTEGCRSPSWMQRPRQLKTIALPADMGATGDVGQWLIPGGRVIAILRCDFMTGTRSGSPTNSRALPLL